MRAIVLLVGMTLVSAACRPANGLEGSIGESRPLQFDHVQITKQDAFLVIQYLRVTTSATEKVCKLVVDTEGLDLPDGGSLRLMNGLFLEHVELQRATVANDAFPAVQSGELVFSDLQFRTGGHADGEFQITFETEGSLSGWFSGTVEPSS